MAISSFNCLRESSRYIPQRYLLTFMSFLGVVIAFVLRNCLGIGILKITPQHDNCNNHTNSNTTDINFHTPVCGSGDIEWSEGTQGVILGSFFYGYCIAHLPCAYLARKLGGKHILGFGILLSSIFSILSPLAACHSSEALICVRIAMGLAEGSVFPAITELLSQWAPPNERTLLSSIVYAGVQIGTVISLGVTAYLLGHMLWSQVFYLLGCVGILWFILWILLCYSKPSLHPFISKKELDYLMEQIPQDRHKTFTPWKAMLKSKPLWALTLAEMGHDYGLYTITSDLPKYYMAFTNLTFSENGVLSGLPYLIMWIVSVLLGYTCDKLIDLKYSTTTRIRRIMATIGAVIPGIGMVCASYQTNQPAVIALIIVSMAFMACCYSSLRVNPLDLSVNHAATIMAITNGSGAISGVIGPSVVGAFLSKSIRPCLDQELEKEKRRSDWQSVFWVIFAVFVLTNFPFLMWGSGDIQPWDKPEEKPSSSGLRRRSTISGGEPIREKYKNYYPEQAAISE